MSKTRDINEFVKALCKDKLDSDLIDIRSLSVLRDNSEYLCALARVHFPAAEKYGFKNIKPNLEELLDLFISSLVLTHNFNLIRFERLEKIIFPYLHIFPHLGERILQLIRKDLDEYRKHIKLSTFVDNLIKACPDISFPFTDIPEEEKKRSESPTDASIVAKLIHSEIQKRKRCIEEQVSTLSDKFCYETTITFPEDKYVADIKAIEPTDDQKQSDDKRPRPTLTDLWLDLVTRLRNSILHRNTHIAANVFLTLHLHLKEKSPQHAAITVLAGIRTHVNTTDKSLFDLAILLSRFLQIPCSRDFDTTMRHFCQKQPDILRQLECSSDFQEFEKFLKSNSKHEQLFTRLITDNLPVDELLNKIMHDLHHNPDEHKINLDKHIIFKVLRNFPDNFLRLAHNAGKFEAFKHVKLNLSRLLEDLIQLDNLQNRHPTEIETHLTNLSQHIFPFLTDFPHLGEKILILIQKILQLFPGGDGSWDLHTFTFKLTQCCPQISFPFDHLQAPDLKDSPQHEMKVSSVIRSVIMERERHLEELVSQQRLKTAALPDCKHVALVSKAAPPRRLYRQTLVDLWRDVVNNLQNNYDKEETQKIFVIVDTIRIHLQNHNYEKAMVMALFGIKNLHNITTVKLLAGFLGIEIEGSFYHTLRKVCQRQFEILNNLKMDYVEFFRFLTANDPHRHLYLLYSRLNSPNGFTKEEINRTIEALQDHNFQINKNSAENLFGMLKFHSETFLAFAISPKKHKNEQIFECFKANLERLLVFVINKENLIHLPAPEIKAHLFALKKFFLPYVKVFPRLGEPLLMVAHDLITEHGDKALPLYRFVKSVIEASPEISFPFTRVKLKVHRLYNGTLSDKNKIEKEIAHALDLRFEKRMNLVGHYIPIYKESQPYLCALPAEAKHLETEQKQKDNFHHPASIKDLWLDLVFRLKHKPADKETAEVFFIFTEIFKGHTELAITYALTGIGVFAASSVTKRRAKLLASFLGMTYESYKPEEYIRTFCQREFEFRRRFESDFQEFLQFLDSNPNHRRTFVCVTQTIPHKPKALATEPKALAQRETKDEKEGKERKLTKDSFDINDFINELHNQMKKLASLSESELRAYIKELQNIIPFVGTFPILGTELLLFVHAIFATPAHGDKRYDLSKFVNNILEENPQISFPYCRLDTVETGMPFVTDEMREINNRIRDALKEREARFCEGTPLIKGQTLLVTRSQTLIAKAKIMQSALQQNGGSELKSALTKFDVITDEAKHHDHAEHSDETSDKPSTTTLTDLWLTTATMLRDQPQAEETYLFCAIFSEIYLYTHRNLNLTASERALAGLQICDDKHLKLRNALLSFLEIPMHTIPSACVSTFCRKQFDVRDRFKQDFKSFQAFLKTNKEHRRLLNVVVHGATYVPTAKDLHGDLFSRPEEFFATRNMRSVPLSNALESDPPIEPVEYTL